MASNLSHGMKRVLSGVMSLLIVAGSSGLPANVGGFLTGGKAIVASAEEEYSISIEDIEAGMAIVKGDIITNDNGAMLTVKYGITQGGIYNGDSPSWTVDGDYYVNSVNRETNDTVTITVTPAIVVGESTTVTTDTTYTSVIAAINSGISLGVSGCTLVLNADTKMIAGAKVKSKTYYTSLNLTNNAVVIINGDLNLGDYCKITAGEGCKVIVTGTVSNDATGTSVTEGAVLTEGFYPEGVSGAISYTPATTTESGYYTIGESDKHYAFNGSNFVEFSEYTLTADSGITVKDSNGNTVTGKVSSLETYTLTSDSEFVLSAGGDPVTATKGDDNKYTISEVRFSSNASAYILKALTGSGTQDDPIIVSDAYNLKNILTTAHRDDTYVKIDGTITLNENIEITNIYQKVHFVGEGKIQGTGKIIRNGGDGALWFEGITANISVDIQTGATEVYVSDGYVENVKVFHRGYVTGGTVNVLTGNSQYSYNKLEVSGGKVNTLNVMAYTATISGGEVGAANLTSGSGTLTISGGNTGTLTVDAGKATISGGTVNMAVNNAENNETGALTITGGTVKSVGKNVTIAGGTIGAFADDVTNTDYVDEDDIFKSGTNVTIVGGTFNVDPTDYINDPITRVVKTNEDGTYTVKERELTGKGTQAEPFIITDENELRYLTSRKSGYFKIENDNNDTIVLNSNFDFGYSKTYTFVGGTINYDINDNLNVDNVNLTIDGGSIKTKDGWYLSCFNSGSITLKNGSVTRISNNSNSNVYIQGGTVTEIINGNSARAIIDGGTISKLTNDTGATAIIDGGAVDNIDNKRDEHNNFGTVIIDDGKITGTLSGEGTYKITGGVFTNNPTSYVSDGNIVVEKDNLYYVNHNSSYQTFSEETNKWTTESLTADKYTKVKSSDTEWTTGTYVVTKDTVLESRVKVSGDVKLVLEDGVTLTAKKGINVKSGNSFTVYGQAQGTGILYAGTTDGQNRTNDRWYAAIGANSTQNSDTTCGAITIYGGQIYAQSDLNAGIGGYSFGANEFITIYGGRVEAKSADHGEGIGVGWDWNGTTVKVYGGTVISHAPGSHLGNSTWYWNPDVTVTDDVLAAVKDTEGNDTEEKAYTTITGNTGRGIRIEAGEGHVISLADCTIEKIPTQDYNNGNAVTPDVTVTYTVGEKTYTLTKGVHYTVSYSDNTNYTEAAKATVTGMGVMTGTKTATFKIDIVQAKYTTEPAAVSELVYNGKAQALITAGAVDGGTIQYGVSSSADTQPTSWSADVPTAAAAGTYYVWTKIVPDKNHRENEAKLVAADGITIRSATMAITIAPKDDIVYDGAVLDASDFTFTGDDAALVSDKDTKVTVTTPGDFPARAGSHFVTVKIERENYETIEKYFSNITIAKRPVIITPTAGLKSTYGEPVLSGTALTYTTSNVIEGENVSFTVDLSVNIPEGTATPDAGEYSYKLSSTDAGNANYVLSIADGAKYVIEPKDISAIKDEFSVTLNGTENWNAESSSYVYDGSSKSVSVSEVGNTQSASVVLSAANSSDNGFELSGYQTGTGDKSGYTIDEDDLWNLTLTIPAGKTVTGIVISYTTTENVEEGAMQEKTFNTDTYTNSVSLRDLLNPGSTTHKVYSVTVTYENTVKTTLTAETDYDLGGDLSRRNPGEYTVQVVGKGNYTGTLTATWSITKAQNEDAQIILLHSGKKDYDGKDVTDLFTVDTGAIPASKATVTYAYYKAVASTENADDWAKDGEALEAAPSAAGDYIVEVTVSGTGYEAVTKTATLHITGTAAKDIESADITVDCPVSALSLTGWTTPKLTIKDGEKELEPNVDFTVNGGKTRSAGTYTIEIEGMGDYSGCREVEWTVEEVKSVVEKTEKYDDQGRITFTVKNTDLGENAKYGVLIKRGLASGTELTTANAETDYALNSAYTTFRVKDLGKGVTVKPYVEVDGVRKYGEQYTVSYIGYSEVEKAEKYDDEGRVTFTIKNTYSGEGETKYGVLIKRGLASGTELTTANAETDYALNSAYTTFRVKDLGKGVTVKPYVEVDGVRKYGEQYTVSYIGYSEVEKAEKYDDEGRITFTVKNTYSGNGTTSYGVLIARGLGDGTELTTDNAETDYALNSAYTTFRVKDTNNGVTLKPYIVVDGERHYGDQVTYKYSELSGNLPS